MTALTESQLTAVVGLLSAALGAAVALIAAILTNRANARSAMAARSHELALRRQDLTRSRGEELYTLLQIWVNRLQGYYLIKASIMSGKITYNQGLDLELKNGEKFRDQHVRIEMLIDVYFPQLRPMYDAIIVHREGANDLVHEHRELYRVGRTDGAGFVSQLTVCQKLIDETSTELSSALLACLRDA